MGFARNPRALPFGRILEMTSSPGLAPVRTHEVGTAMNILGPSGSVRSRRIANSLGDRSPLEVFSGLREKRREQASPSLVVCL